METKVVHYHRGLASPETILELSACLTALAKADGFEALTFEDQIRAAQNNEDLRIISRSAPEWWSDIRSRLVRDNFKGHLETGSRETYLARSIWKPRGDRNDLIVIDSATEQNAKKHHINYLLTAVSDTELARILEQGHRTFRAYQATA